MRLTLSLFVLSSSLAFAGRVKVDGSDIRFPDSLKENIEGQEHSLRITGTALREKVFVNVYAMASYVATEANLKGASALIDADVAKKIVLKMERDVDGDTMYEALKDALKRNSKGFKGPLSQFRRYFTRNPAKEKVIISFLHLPGKGLECRIGKAKKLMIADVAFSKAVWKIWLGRKPVDGDIKKALIKRL